MARQRVDFSSTFVSTRLLWAGLTIRINVTWNAGAGKTTLATNLGRALDLPVHSLDPIVWQPGWKKTPLEERRAAEPEMIAEPAWIIDGVSSTVRHSDEVGAWFSDLSTTAPREARG